MKDNLKKFVVEDLSRARVMVIGDVMLDKYYFGEVSRISPEAPVPINHVLQIKETLGGAANVAHNLALSGGKVFIVGHAGKGNHGETLLKKMTSRGIDVSGMVLTDRPTTTKIRVISGHQQMMRLDFENSDDIVGEPANKLLENFSVRLKEVDAVIISDYGKGVCTENTCAEIIRLCRQSGKIVVVDPKGDDWTKYTGADFITPNLKEFNAVLPKKIKNNDEEVEPAARLIIDKFNLNGLVVTRSAAGLTLIDGEKVSHIKARAQEVFDVSGAGDTVIAVFAAGLAGGLDSEAAAYLANIAAGVVVAKVGTYAVSLEELLNAVDFPSKI